MQYNEVKTQLIVYMVDLFMYSSILYMFSLDKCGSSLLRFIFSQVCFANEDSTERRWLIGLQFQDSGSGASLYREELLQGGQPRSCCYSSVFRFSLSCEWWTGICG